MEHTPTNQETRGNNSRTATEGKISGQTSEIKTKSLVYSLNAIMNEINDKEIQIKILTSDFKQRKILWKHTSWYKNTSLIYNSKKKLILPNFNSNEIFKTFILALNNFYILKRMKYDHTSSLHNLEKIFLVMCKLYNDNYFSINHVLYAIKFFFILSTLRKDFYTDKISKIEYSFQCGDMVNLAISLLNIFIKSKLNYNNEKDITEFILFLNFIKNKFLYNNQENIFYLSNNSYETSDLFGLINILRNINYTNKELFDDVLTSLNEFYLQIYKFNFSHKKVMTPFINETKKILINFQTKPSEDIEKDLNILTFIIKYLKINSDVESREYQNDFYKLDKGFFLLDRKSYMLINNFNTEKKERDIFFGFQFHPELIKANTKEEKTDFDNEFVLITLMSKDNSIFKLCIKRDPASNKYYLYIYNKKKNAYEDTKITIRANTYLIFIELKKDNKINITCSESKGKNVPKEFEISFTSNDGLKCIYGNDETFNNGFIGYLGTLFIITNKTKSNKKIETLLSYKGKYEHILYDNTQYKMEHYTKYNKMIENDYSNKNENILKGLQYELIISPQSFSLVENVNHYEISNEKKEFKKKANFLNVKSNNIYLSTCKVEINQSFDQKFHLFKNKFIITEFLKCGGINYICMIFDYISEILDLKDLKENNSLIKQIYNVIVNLLEFLVTILPETRILNFVDDITLLFTGILETIHKLMKISKMEQKLFDLLINLTVFLKATIITYPNDNFLDQIEKLKDLMFSFILTSDYYSDKNLEFLCVLFYTLNKNFYSGDLSFEMKKILNKIYKFFSMINDIISGKDFRRSLNEATLKGTPETPGSEAKSKLLNAYFELIKTIIKGEITKFNEKIESANDIISKSEKNKKQRKESKGNKDLLLKTKDDLIKEKMITIKDYYSDFYESHKDYLRRGNNEIVNHIMEFLYSIDDYSYLDVRIKEFLFDNMKHISNKDKENHEYCKYLLYIIFDTCEVNFENKMLIENCNCSSIIKIDLILKYLITTKKDIIIKINKIEDIKFDKEIPNKRNSSKVNMLLEIFFDLVYNKKDLKIVTIKYFDILCNSFMYGVLSLDNKKTSIFHDLFKLDIFSKIFYEQYCNNSLLILDDKRKNDQKILDVFISVSATLLFSHSDSFILKFLISDIENNNFDSLFYQNALDYLLKFYFPYLQEKDDEENIYNYKMNLCNILEICSIIIKRKNVTVIEDPENIRKLISYLFNSSFILSKFISQNYNKDKLISELFFDYVINLIIKKSNETKSDKNEYLKLIHDVFFIPEKFKKGDNKRTIFMLVDLNDGTKSHLSKYINYNSDFKDILNELQKIKNFDIFKDKKEMNQIYVTELILVKLCLYLKKYSILQRDLNDFLKILIKELKELYKLNIIKNSSKSKLLKDLNELFKSQSDEYEISNRIINEFLNTKFINDPDELNYKQLIEFKDKEVEGPEIVTEEIEVNVNKKRKRRGSCPNIQSKNRSLMLDRDIEESIEEDELETDKFIDIRKIVKNLRKEYICTTFSINFIDILFENELFIKMKKYYNIYFPESNTSTKGLNYPSKLKRFYNSFEPPFFLKQDSNFFTDQYFPISHSYFTKDLIKKLPIDQINFKNKVYKINHLKSKSKLIFSCECELINITKVFFGKIYIFKEFIFFEQCSNEIKENTKNKLKYVLGSLDEEEQFREESKKQLLIYYDEINEILPRRFLYIHKAMEIFTKNGKGYFFNFYNIEDYDALMKNLNEERQKCLKTQERFVSIEELKNNSINCLIDKWKCGKITNYTLLLELNKLSSRTYNNTNQYPVFPWILKDCTELLDDSFKFNIKRNKNEMEPLREQRAYSNVYFPRNKLFNIDNQRLKSSDSNAFNYSCEPQYRLLQFPISAQTDEKQTDIRNKFIEYKEMYSSAKKKKFVSGLSSHYSTSAFIYFYLIRLNPYSNLLIRLQNGLENPNRMFLSVLETQEVLESSCDNRELIPEFFCQTEFMANLNCIFFGKKNVTRERKKLIDDLLIDNKGNDEISFNCFVHFINRHRLALNSLDITKNIHEWINFIFGVKQTTGRAEDCNTFPKYTYEQNVDLNYLINKYKENPKNDKITNDYAYKKINDKISIIFNFGMSPYQILDKPLNKNERDDSEDLSLKNKFKKKAKEIQPDAEHILYMAINKNKKTEANVDWEIYILNRKKEINIITKSNNQIESDRKRNLVSFKFSSPNKEKIEHSKIYLDKLEYSFITLNNNSIFIACRKLDNSFKIHIINEAKKDSSTVISVYVDEFIYSLGKINENEFFSGSQNGVLSKWKFDNATSNCNLLKSIYAHEGVIYTIDVYKRLGIVVTGGSDSHVFIRKIYDLELLTSIKLNKDRNSKNYKILNCKVSDTNFLYVFCYDYNKTMVFFGYTLTGINFSVSKSDCCYSNFAFTNGGNILTMDYKKNDFYLLQGHDLQNRKNLNLKKAIIEKKENKGSKDTKEGTKIEWFDYNKDLKLLVVSFGKIIRYFESDSEIVKTLNDY